MMKQLDELSLAIRQAAADREFVVFDGRLNTSALASVLWNGDCLSFLDLARQVKVSLVYIDEQRYDLYDFVFGAMADADLLDNMFADKQTNKEHIILPRSFRTDESRLWLEDRIRERIATWQDREGQLTRVRCIWVKDHVAHCWQQYADWFLALHAEITSIINEAEQVKQEQRVSHSQEVALKLHEYANRIARHPRFSEATSEEKREFMVSQLFPETIDNDELGFRPALSIAKRATLIYWWDVAPSETIAKAEQARTLYAQGESMRSIAAVLKMSEAKVRAAINSTNSP